MKLNVEPVAFPEGWHFVFDHRHASTSLAYHGKFIVSRKTHKKRCFLGTSKITQERARRWLESFCEGRYAMKYEVEE